MKQFFFNRKHMGYLLIFILVSCVAVCGNDVDTETRQVIHRFFTLVHRGNYPEAYGYFSMSVKRDISQDQFTEGAQNVRYLKILSIDKLDKEDNLTKTRIRALIHLLYKGALYEAVYEGRVVLYRENTSWKVMTVDLDVKSQKLLDKSAKANQLQKLDFGTK